MIKYHQYKKIDKNYIKNKISEFLIEDMPSGDLTTENIIQSINNSTAQIQAVDELVFIGSTIIPHFFNKKCKIEFSNLSKSKIKQYLDYLEASDKKDAKFYAAFKNYLDPENLPVQLCISSNKDLVYNEKKMSCQFGLNVNTEFSNIIYPAQFE